MGSYSSGGANYKIFADGSIEAELSEGTLKFASMSEFKGYLAEKKGDRASRRVIDAGGRLAPDDAPLSRKGSPMRPPPAGPLPGPRRR